MKITNKQLRESGRLHVLGESEKDFRAKCFREMISETIADLNNIRDFKNIDMFRELRGKKAKIVIEYDLKYK